MKKLFLFPLLFLTIFSAISAQTLKIAHKSHGGKAATFTPGDFDLFGTPPEWRIEKGNTPKKPEEPKDPFTGEKTPEQPPQTPQPAETPSDPAEQPEEIRSTPDSEMTPQPTPDKTQPAKPGKIKKRNQKRSHDRSDSSTEATENEITFTEDTPAPSAQLTEQRASRMKWLYGLMGLVILPGIVLASGAFRKSSGTTV